jgi:hypothetical protein
MDEALKVVIEMNEWIWNRFKDDLKDVTSEEINWQPLPQANTINAILRHLHIEAKWHLASIEHGEQMPSQVPVSVQQTTDSVPLDFERNLKELEELYTRFIATLRTTMLAGLQQQSALAYQDFPCEGRCPAHLLSFHQAVHLAGHWGQIRTIRNLYRKTRGEPARFFPDNPTFPP